MTKLKGVEGFETVLARRLQNMGIETLEELLAAGRNKEGRKAVATEVQVTIRTITRWVSIADLSRVNGIHIKYAKLLQNAGIKCVQDLASANPADLHIRLDALNRYGRKHVDRVPAVSRITCWIATAKETRPMLEIQTPVLVTQVQRPTSRIGRF